MRYPIEASRTERQKVNKSLIQKRLPAHIVSELTLANKLAYIEYNQDAIIYLYKNKNWGLLKIARFFSVNPKSIKAALKRWSQPVRTEEKEFTPRITKRWLTLRGIISPTHARMLSNSDRRAYIEFHKDYIIFLNHKKNWSLNKIGAIFGLSGYTIRKYFKDWGIEYIGRPKTEFIEKNKQKIIQLYTRKNNPLTAAQIGKMLGLAEPTINLRLKSWNIKARDYKKIGDSKECAKLFMQGWTVSELKLKYHCSDLVIYRALNKEGIKNARKLRFTKPMKRFLVYYMSRGLSIAQITRLLQKKFPKLKKRLTYTVVRYRTKKWRIRLAKPKEMDDSELFQAFNLSGQGWKINTIADVLELHPDVVRRTLLKFKKKEIISFKDITKELRDEVIRLNNRGLSLSEIAFRTKTTKRVILHILKINLITKRSKVRKYKQSELDEYAKHIRKWRKEGITVAEMAKRLNISTATLNRVINEYKIPHKPWKKFSPEKEREVIKLSKEGVHYAEIAKKINMSPESIRNKLLHLRLPTNIKHDRMPYTQSALIFQNKLIRKYYLAPHYYSAFRLGKILNLDKTTIVERLKNMKIKPRTAAQAKSLEGLKRDPIILTPEQKELLHERVKTKRKLPTRREL